MASIDLNRFDIGQLADLPAKAHADMASREEGNRRELRTEIGRRVAAEGHQLADVFSELGTTSSSSGRRKRPARFRDSQHREQT